MKSCKFPAFLLLLSLFFFSLSWRSKNEEKKKKRYLLAFYQGWATTDVQFQHFWKSWKPLKHFLVFCGGFRQYLEKELVFCLIFFLTTFFNLRRRMDDKNSGDVRLKKRKEKKKKVTFAVFSKLTDNGLLTNLESFKIFFR